MIFHAAFLSPVSRFRTQKASGCLRVRRYKNRASVHTGGRDREQLAIHAACRKTTVGLGDRSPHFGWHDDDLGRCVFKLLLLIGPRRCPFCSVASREQNRSAVSGSSGKAAQRDHTPTESTASVPVSGIPLFDA